MAFVKGIHHVALRCAGEEEMKKTILLYTDILGLKVLRTWGSGASSGCMLDTGSGIIEVFANAEPGRPAGNFEHLAFAADDVDGCIEAVRKAGYTITDEPRDIAIPSDPPFPARIAFFKGAAGEIVEIFCER